MEVKVSTTDNAKRNKTLEFDDASYRSGIGNTWGGWAGLAGAAAVGLAIALRKPQAAKGIFGFLDNAIDTLTKPVTTVLGAAVGAVGFGLIGNVAGQVAGNGEAKQIKKDFYETLAENEGLKRENAVLKETKSFAEREHSRDAARQAGEHNR